MTCFEPSRTGFQPAENPNRDKPKLSLGSARRKEEVRIDRVGNEVVHRAGDVLAILAFGSSVGNRDFPSPLEAGTEEAILEVKGEPDNSPTEPADNSDEVELFTS